MAADALGATSAQRLAELADALSRRVHASGHRHALVLTGSAAWGREAAQAALQAWDQQDLLWIADEPPPSTHALAPGHARQVLGQEVAGLVFDAHGGFNPDALGAVAGTLRAGGLLCLLVPPLAEWPRLPDAQAEAWGVAGPHAGGRFLARISAIVRQHPGATVVAQGAAWPEPPSVAFSAPPPASLGPYRTPDQQQAVREILRVAQGHRRRPLVLTADRGRGKSAALGLAAGRLLQQDWQTIVVTAPRRAAVAPVFKHAAEQWGQTGGAVSGLAFVPPDELVRHPRRAALLLVDEAAAIPTPLLAELLRRYARIVFATTVHGYEGSGRGFALRFHPLLDRQTPGWRSLTLETPVRWAAGDPLEALIFRLLCLDARLPDTAVISSAEPARCVVERVDRDTLATDETRLSQLFGLLVLAHYRTRPHDLRYLLDAPQVWVNATTYRGQVVATALVAEEGGFAPDLAQAVVDGRRRPRGHLLASLSPPTRVWSKRPCCMARGSCVLRSILLYRVGGWGASSWPPLPTRLRLLDTTI